MNQLVPIVQSNAGAYRASTDAAGLCGEIVKRTAKNIQGRKYVGVEGWQAIAIAHGCAASALEVERVSEEGLSGFKCVGVVRRMIDGAEISRGEGFLGDDENTWSKRPVYARRAMVQTRAISRACRSAFAHVVVMIDGSLSTTPAEEVPDEGFRDGAIEGDFHATPQPRKSSAQAKRDGDYERLTTGMRAATDEASLKAWGAENADDIGALPVKWQSELRAEFTDLLRGFKAKAADPVGVYVEPPEHDATVETWSEYFEDVLRAIGGAVSVEEVAEAQRVNEDGISLAALVVENAENRIATVAEARCAELTAKAA